MKKLSIVFSIFIILALVLAVKPVQAAEVGQWLTFYACHTNDAGDVAIGVAQMRVKVVEFAEGQVEFYFENIGPAASSITDVYFDDGALFGISTIIPGPGVIFSQPATPPELPSGNECEPPFVTSQGFFSADSTSPPQPNGVNPGEYVRIIFDLKDDKTIADVIADLGSGDLRIGIHVQGFASGGSEAFITGGSTAVELMSFNALARNGNVNVKWATGTELNNAGFNLYRSSSGSGSRTQLNNALIAAHGDAVSGGTYSFTDAPGYGTFFYWLEDVELGGTATLNGPVVVTAWPSIRLPVSRPAVP